jgi:arsenate reductase
VLCARLLRSQMKNVIFACVHNAGRSQMAATLFNALAERSGSRFRATSAGTSPAGRVHPQVIAVMSELGFDLASAKPQLLTEELARHAELLVTMGCGDRCPHVPGLKVEDWPLEDPKDKPIERVRAIRDEISGHVAELVHRLTNLTHR